VLGFGTIFCIMTMILQTIQLPTRWSPQR